MDKDYAQYLLKKTIGDYNRIAEQFSSSRYSIWPELNLFKEYIKEGERVLDSGCGNGRLLELFKDCNVDYIGIDNSEKLLEIARNKHPQQKFQLADSLSLPFPNDYFNKIFSIAVFHHIPSKELRLRFLKEAKRALRPDGLLILTVWNLWQRPKTLKLLFKFTMLKVAGKSKLDFKDIFVSWGGSRAKASLPPWQKKTDRYIHCFTKNELKKIAKEAGFKIIKAGTLKRGEIKNCNIYLIVKKPH